MTTPKLNKALVDARSDLHNPVFDSANPHYKNKFASLRAVANAVFPVFAKHGIAIVQDLQTIEGGIACYTHFLHESGEERMFGPLIMNATKSDPQGYASASTYARRYHLMSVAGVVGDADDDAGAASASAFSSKQMRTKYWNGLRDAASEADELKARELWDEMDSDQQQEVWKDLSSGIRSEIKKLLEITKPEVTA